MIYWSIFFIFYKTGRKIYQQNGALLSIEVIKELKAITSLQIFIESLCKAPLNSVCNLASQLFPNTRENMLNTARNLVCLTDVISYYL